ncbi:MAG: glycosyltransferase family 9 protein [Planctomycetota bacterium]
MPTPQQHARLINDWLELQDPAALPDLMAGLPADHSIFEALDAISDAADSEEEEIAAAGIAALFRDCVEVWNDSLSVRLRAVYSRLFAHVIWRCAERDALMHAALAEHGVDSETALWQRHQRLRQAPGRAPTMTRRILVLSRVTIGADILITSVLLQHLRQAFPGAEIKLVGDPKLEGLLGGFSGMQVVPLRYARRGRLRNRLRAWLAVRELASMQNADIVINPDSRLDQLGLLPLLDEERTLLWENTLPDGQAHSLAELMSAWCCRRLPNACTIAVRPQLYPSEPQRIEQTRLRRACGAAPLAAVKLDHGGNPAKALPMQAEVAILHRLRACGWRIILDRGFDASEFAHSDALLDAARLHAIDISDGDAAMGLAVGDLCEDRLAAEPVIRFHGSIAGWAACLACSRLAVSYDSVGQHLAAASGIPVIVPFAGYEHASFPDAWRPVGHAPTHVHRFDDEASKRDPTRLAALLEEIPPAD